MKFSVRYALSRRKGWNSPSRIYLFQCLPKSDKMELVIQKAVELGACAVIPVAAKRCVMKLDAKKEKNKLARWQQIAGSGGEAEQTPHHSGGSPMVMEHEGGVFPLLADMDVEAVSL